MAGDLDLSLLAALGVLLVAIGGVQLSAKLGFPSLLLYLGIGLALGDNGLGLAFDDAHLARDLGLVALALILAEGGLTTRWPDVRPVMPVAAVLSTIGVAVSIGVTCLAARLVLGTGWQTAALMAAVLAPTDAAAVFSTLRMLRVPRRLAGLLEAESGLNDAPVVIAVALLSSRHPSGAAAAAGSLVYELAVGAGVGIAVAVVATALLRRAALPAAGLYPLATLAFTMAAYAGATTAGASGFLAVYLTALWLGNVRLPHRRATVGFAEGIAWLAQISLFVMLGLLATPSRLGHAILPAAAIGAALLLVARPLSVLVSTLPFRYRWREQLFLSVAGLRGAVPIVLTTIPLTTGVAGSRRVFDVVFVLVVLFTVVQSPLIAPMARALHLSRPGDGHELHVEAAPLDAMSADLLTLTVPTESRLHGVTVWELDLPAGTSIVYIIREGRGLVPEAGTALRAGDEMLLVAPRADRMATERRLLAVSRSGRLARFHGDLGDDG